MKYLLAEVVGDESVVPAELGDELVRILVEPERHPRQLQPGGPAFCSGDERGHPVDSEWTTADVLEQLGRFDVIEGEVGLSDLCQLVAQAMATPRNGEISPGRKHQMNIGRKKIGQTSKIRNEDRVRKVVEIVEDDHDLGQVGQLYLESFEQWRTEPPSMERRQSSQIGEVRVDRRKSREKLLGEPDRVIVVDANFHPYESQFGMARRPLREEHRLSRTSRRNDQ